MASEEKIEQNNSNATSNDTLRSVFADTTVQQGDVNIDHLTIPGQSTQTTQTQIDLSGGYTPHIQEDPQLHSWRQFIRLTFITVVVAIVALVLFVVYQYNYQLSLPTTNNAIIQRYADTIHTNYKQLLIRIGGAKHYIQWRGYNMIGDATQSFETLLGSSLSFVDKKYILQNAIDRLLVAYTAKTEELDIVQRDIAQFGFLPQDIISIYENSDVQVSLQRGLLALESIKFSTAIQVFSYLDTFVNALANYLGVSPEYAKAQMQAISARGDQDIYAFLSHCYMNPYEFSYDCDVMGDFDTWYMLQTDRSVDPDFLKKLLSYIDQRLEQTDVPSFNIIFQRFDPRAETITFSIEVNTFQQDEAILVQAGITNPHIFIVTSVIHLLKQNRFIQGSSLEAKQINIQPKVVRIGSNQFIVNNSLLQYTLPLQKDIAREIYDFEAQ